MTALLSLRGLTKAYPGVVANDDVSLSIEAGEVHALLGENGAGKSTLVKMIYGLVKPDSGQMLLRGAPFAPAEPRAARADGIAMVFQTYAIWPHMNVFNNVAYPLQTRKMPKDVIRRKVEKTLRFVQLDGFPALSTAVIWTRNLPSSCSGPRVAVYKLSAGVMLTGTESCAIRDCFFNQLGGNGVFFNNYNRHSEVTGSRFHQL